MNRIAFSAWHRISIRNADYCYVNKKQVRQASLVGLLNVVRKTGDQFKYHIDGDSPGLPHVRWLKNGTGLLIQTEPVFMKGYSKLIRRYSEFDLAMREAFKKYRKTHPKLKLKIEVRRSRKHPWQE